MTYIHPISSFITMDADMARRSPEEAERFAREASALALPKLPPITPPEGLTRSQANKFIATMEVFRRPDVVIEGTGTQLRKLTS